MWLKSPAGTFRNRSLRLIEHWEGGGTKTRSLGKECLALCLSSRHTEELPSEQVGEHNKGFVRAGRRENVCMERRNERRQREKREGGETLIQVIACLFAPVKAIKKMGQVETVMKHSSQRLLRTNTIESRCGRGKGSLTEI